MHIGSGRGIEGSYARFIPARGPANRLTLHATAGRAGAI
jgi:hypothetical protein